MSRVHFDQFEDATDDGDGHDRERRDELEHGDSAVLLARQGPAHG
jgi:hypothetical protein